MNSLISFILLDDHPAMIEGLKAILERDGKFTCAGTATDTSQAKDLIANTDYDLMITDIRFPDGTGFELAEYAKNLHAERPILFMSMYLSFDYIVKAFRSGASGFISKDAAASSLIIGAEQIHSGNQFLDSSSLSLVLGTITHSGDTAFIDPEEPFHELTSRERDIFDLLISRKSTKEIAQRLGISPKTVMNHRQNIFFKLKVDNELELKHYADRIGVIPKET